MSMARRMIIGVNHEPDAVEPERSHIFIIPKLVRFLANFHKMKAPAFSSKTGATSAGGPVSRILSRTAIPLGASLLARSSDLPGGFRSATACAALDGPRGRAGPARARSIGPTARLPPYLVLLRVGFTMPPPLPPERCALTAPFHPYPQPLRAGAVCFLWHWPSRGLYAAIPDVIRHTALRSSDFPLPDRLAPSRQRPSSPPAISIVCKHQQPRE